MSDTAAIGEALVEQIARRLDGAFERDVENARLVQPFAGGSKILQLQLVPTAQGIDVVVHAAIRHDAVERLFDAATATSSSRSATIGAELGALEGVGQRRWTVRSAADVPAVSDSIARAFDVRGRPLLERFADLPETLSMLARDDAAARPYSPIPLQRALRAVAAAQVLGQRDRAEEIAKAKRAWFEQAGIGGLEQFVALLEALDRQVPER